MKIKNKLIVAIIFLLFVLFMTGNISNASTKTGGDIKKFYYNENDKWEGIESLKAKGDEAVGDFIYGGPQLYDPNNNQLYCTQQQYNTHSTIPKEYQVMYYLELSQGGDKVLVKNVEAGYSGNTSFVQIQDLRQSDISGSRQAKELGTILTYFDDKGYKGNQADNSHTQRALWAFLKCETDTGWIGSNFGEYYINSVSQGKMTNFNEYSMPAYQTVKANIRI